MNRKPTSPGEILKYEFLLPMGLTQSSLAKHIGCDVKVINRIVNERSAVTAEIAIKLGIAFRTSADFWLNAQKSLDLYKANKMLKKRPQPFSRRRLEGSEVA